MDLSHIINLANKEPKSLEEMGLKLTEETGEVAEAILKYKKASGSQYKHGSLDDLKEECADTLLVALSLYFQLENSSTEELDNLLMKKCHKWEKHMQIEE